MIIWENLSLNWPSVKALGDDVRGVLHIVAFLPQGVLREKIKELFPTIGGIEEITNVLLKQSLLLCNNGLVTMLAPIRLYLCDGCPEDLLPAAREYCYGQLSSSLPGRGVVVARAIAHDLSPLSADDELEAVVSTCEAFIRTLCRGTCHSTSLRPVIDGLDTSLSPTRKKLKLRCYTPLSVLANRQSDFSNALQLQYYRLLGQYGTAQTILDQAIASPDWATADERTRAHFIFTRTLIKQCNDIQLTGPGSTKMFDECRRFAEAAGEVESTDSAITQGNFSGLVASDWVSARSSLEASIATVLQADPGRPSLSLFFSFLATVALVGGRMDEARQPLKNAVSLRVRWQIRHSAGGTTNPSYDHAFRRKLRGSL